MTLLKMADSTPCKKVCHVLVEGHGEVAAAQNLLTRLGAEVGLQAPWATPRRWLNLHQWDRPRRGGVRAGAEFVRLIPEAGALLILRDEDDDCPREAAPRVAAKLRGLRLPFPVAYVLLHPEYEVLFLPSLHRMSSLGFPPGLRWDGATWEARRGVKEWLSAQLPRGRSYKPSVDQLAMTRRVDLPTTRDAGIPCFGSLERALAFLAEQFGRPGAVYPCRGGTVSGPASP